tara:strand:+ start:172 stop:447 length:276 start_codon:yes stop_codon:yes gene_type:complete
MSFKKLLNRLCFDRTTTNENPPPPKPSDIIEYTIEKKFDKDYECIICLEEFNENETVSITKCGHLYHTQCIYSWFLKKRTCPICDIEIRID